MIDRMLQTGLVRRFGRSAGLALGLAAALAGIPGFLSSCSVLPREETLEVYQLPASPITRSIQTNGQPWTLHVATPRSSRVTDSVRVLILQQGNRISAYKGVRWSDPAPVLMRDRLVSAFRADGRLGPVSSDSNLPADLQLKGDLGAFQVEYQNGMPSVNIRFYATLVQSARNRIVATRSFEVKQPADGRNVSDVVTAFGKATDMLASEMIGWALQHGPALQPGNK